MAGLATLQVCSIVKNCPAAARRAAAGRKHTRRAVLMREASATKTADKTDRAEDPVCGMTTNDPQSYIAHDYQGWTYYFCSQNCLDQFKSEPDKYIGPDAHPDDHTDEKDATTRDGRSEMAVFTCPMHPEVRQRGPGDCPKCGMALEPEAGGQKDDQEYRFLRNRFWASAALPLPLMLIAMRDLIGLGTLERMFGAVALHWTEFALATPVVLWGGASSTFAPGIPSAHGT
jgi:YHS domain-containing protein